MLQLQRPCSRRRFPLFPRSSGEGCVFDPDFDVSASLTSGRHHQFGITIAIHSHLPAPDLVVQISKERSVATKVRKNIVSAICPSGL